MQRYRSVGARQQNVAVNFIFGLGQDGTVIARTREANPSGHSARASAPLRGQPVEGPPGVDDLPFNPEVEHAQIAERFDLAVMSTKGMSATAARMLLNNLAKRGVERPADQVGPLRTGRVPTLAQSGQREVASASATGTANQ